jgi:hypothetical protein
MLAVDRILQIETLFAAQVARIVVIRFDKTCYDLRGTL